MKYLDQKLTYFSKFSSVDSSLDIFVENSFHNDMHNINVVISIDTEIGKQKKIPFAWISKEAKWMRISNISWDI